MIELENKAMTLLSEYHDALHEKSNLSLIVRALSEILQVEEDAGVLVDRKKQLIEIHEELKLKQENASYVFSQKENLLKSLQKSCPHNKLESMGIDYYERENKYRCSICNKYLLEHELNDAMAIT